MQNATDLGGGEFEKEFLHDFQPYRARINTSSEPVVGVIFDANGNEVATIDLPQETLQDMKVTGAGDHDEILDILIEVFANQEEMTDDEADEG
jgi:hypothetical protein